MACLLAVSGPLILSSSNTAFALSNGGFEEGAYAPTAQPTDWMTGAWDPSAVFTWDNTQARGGTKSVKITAATQNDASWTQSVAVAPNTWYRLAGWIKTENVANSLQPVDAGANLSVVGCFPDIGCFTYSTPIFGTNDWMLTYVDFNSESNTQVTIGGRLGFFSGTTTGVAWFDDLELSVLPPTPTPTATPTITPTFTPTNTATNTPFCGDGEVDIDVGEECDQGSPNPDDCCDDACRFNAADADCEDGDLITCPDKCDGSGTCVPGNDESTECRNTCCDGVDNDGDASTDIEDGGCGLGQESRTAVVTTSPKRNAIKMGGRVNIASLDLEVNRPDCDEPYTYRTQAGICGEQMSLRKDGEVGFVATLATEALSGGQSVVFGKGFDIRSHWVSDGLPAESQEPPPLVGMGTCSLGGESCTQPLTPLALGASCASASAGACCPNPGAVCEGRMDLFDPNNPNVITDGSHPDYARCQALRTALADSSDAVAALVPNHPLYDDTDEPERIRVLPASIPPNCDAIDDADACTPACAEYCTITLGAGQQVLYVDSIDVKRDMPLRLCRDFNLTASDPPTVAIMRIADSFKLSPGARIEACGVPPDRILWNAEGEKGSVKFARGADLIGTVLAPRRKSIKFGGDATLRGSLFAPIVTFSKFTEMYHYPFSAGLE